METELGRQIRQARQAAGLTLEDVAEQVGVTAGALSHIESGRRLPSASNAVLIAEALSLPAEDILGSLDQEHSIKRENAAYETLSLRDATRDRPAHRSRAYVERDVSELFDASAASPGPSSAAYREAPGGSWLQRPSQQRNDARWGGATSRRIEALDRLADSAADAIRTLRGLLDDEDPVVSREARRLLRELDVRMPEE